MKNPANLQKWDQRFLDLAKLVGSWSKDPSTQTGAVIVDDRRIVSTGYNGFPVGIADTEERLNDREMKYKLVVHCEVNAMLYARENLYGMTLYTHPFMSCTRCAVQVIQAGIRRHVAPVCPPDKWERWKDDMLMSMKLFAEAGVQVDLVL
jgi:dCMP deaminase